jgi:hypothetical protein
MLTVYCSKYRESDNFREFLITWYNSSIKIGRVIWIFFLKLKISQLKLLNFQSKNSQIPNLKIKNVDSQNFKILKSKIYKAKSS